MKTMELHHNSFSHISKTIEHSATLEYSSDPMENARIKSSITQGLEEVEMMKKGLLPETTAEDLLEELESIVNETRV